MLTTIIIYLIKILPAPEVEVLWLPFAPFCRLGVSGRDYGGPWQLFAWFEGSRRHEGAAPEGVDTLTAALQCNCQEKSSWQEGSGSFLLCCANPALIAGRRPSQPAINIWNPVRLRFLWISTQFL
jgi:hypothetical protein